MQVQTSFTLRTAHLLLFLPGAEISLIAESFGLLNYLLLPFLLILDASCPIFYLHLANVLLDVILLSAHLLTNHIYSCKVNRINL